MKELLTDSWVVEFMEQKGDPVEKAIPYMYESGILKKGQPFEGSRWGIHFSCAFEDYEDRPVAIHEAGHAVVYLEYGAQFEYLEFSGTFEAAHLVEISEEKKGYRSSAKYRNQWLAEETSYAGGPVATSILLYNNATTWGEGAAADIIVLSAKEWLFGYGYVQEIVDNTIAIVTKRWTVVEAMAAELLKIKKLNYGQCVKMFDRINRNSDGAAKKG